MNDISIIGTGLWYPDEITTNEEIVNSYNTYVDNFNEVNKLIKLEKFAEAHKMLKGLKKINTDEADRLNLLGFTARKSGNLTAAGDFYEQALAINPRHTGALEYQGELFIQLGKIELAKANLEKIDKICWLPCNAERDLKKAIEKSTANQ